MDDVLILKWNLRDIAVPRQDKYRMDTPYRWGNSKIAQSIRLLWKKIHFPLYEKIWYKRIKNFIGTIIIFDAMIEEKLICELVKNNPKARIIFWYWNTVTPKKVQPQVVKKLGCDVWSFNIEDCKKYNLKLNHTYYCQGDYESICHKDISECKYDLIYIGRDKGRLEKINRLMQKDGFSDLRLYKYIVADHIWEIFKKKEYRKPIAYHKVIKLQNEAKGILEMVPYESRGLTLRVMDALIMEKKLITDNSLLQQMEFYCPENIYILGGDNKYDIKEFLEIPYKKLDETVKKKYSFEMWICRFLENKPQEWSC